MARRSLVAVALVAVAAGGCTRADLSDAGLVVGLRMLGAKAEPPEAFPGQRVTVTAWVVDPRGGNIDVSWSACLLPSNGLANPGCTVAGAGVMPLGNGQTITFAVPMVTPAMLGPPDATLGHYLPLVMHATANGDSVDGIYRLRVADGAQPANNNPVLLSIDNLTSSVPPPVHRDEVWPMIANYSLGSREAYKLPPAPDDVHEALTTQWFATAGSFPNSPVGGTGVQSLKMDRALPAAGGTIDVWVVGHDDRGGTDMQHGQLVFE